MIIEDRRYLVTMKKSNGETGELSMLGLYLKLTLNDGSCDVISWREAAPRDGSRGISSWRELK